MQIPQNPQWGAPRFNQQTRQNPWMEALRRLGPMQPGFNPQNIAGNPQVGQYSSAFNNLMQNSGGMQSARAGSGFNPATLFGQRPSPFQTMIGQRGIGNYTRQNLPAAPAAGGYTPQALAQLRQQHIAQNRVPAARNPVY